MPHIRVDVEATEHHLTWLVLADGKYDVARRQVALPDTLAGENGKLGWDQHSGAVGVNRFISYDPSASRRIASETRHCDCDRIVRRGNGPEANWSNSASDDQCRRKGKG